MSNPLLLRRRAIIGANSAEPVLPYDARIEYLESTGTQYIDTGIFGNQDTEVEIEWMVSAANGRYLYGCASVGDTSSLYAYISTISPFKFGNIPITLSGITTGVWHHTIHNSEGLDYDGTTYAGIYQSTFVTPYTILLFSGHTNSGDIGFKTIGKIKTFIVRENGVDLLNMIPVRVGQVGYMYDFISGQLYANAGTGDFILGPDI